MRIASWPGRAFDHNPFMNIFLDGLEAAGAEIISCESIEDLVRADVDVVILQWAETVLWQSHTRTSLIANVWKLRRFFARHVSKRPKLVWLAHNLEPHTKGRLQKLLWGSYVGGLTSGVDGVLTLSPGTVAPVRDAFPALADTPMTSVWHPSYPSPAISRAAARSAAGFTQTDYVLGYCGQIRDYKGIDLALDAFVQTDDPTLKFYVAGKPMDLALTAKIQAIAKSDSRVSLRLADLEGPEFEAALICCDTIVAPFRNYLHSGSLIHALSVGCRVLTPASPFATSLCQELSEGYVTTYTGSLTPALLQGQCNTSPETPANLSAFAPETVAQEVLAFLDEVMQPAS